MGVKYFITKFSDLAEDNVMRCDEKFFSFFLKNRWYLYPNNKNETIQLKDILEGDYNVFNLENEEDYKGIPTGGGYIDEDGEISDYQAVNSDNCPGRIKYSMTNENIAISSLRLAKAPAIYFENLNLSDYIFSNGYYIFKIKNNWNKKFVLYLLRLKSIKRIIDNYIYRGIGISAYREEDLLKIKIPSVSSEQQDEIVQKIEPIEQKIKELKTKIKPIQEFINEVFSREFGYDENLYQEFGKGMTAGSQWAEKKQLRTFFVKQSSLSMNKRIRCGTRYHNPPTIKLMNILKNMDTVKVKDILKEPIHRGVTPKYDNDGEIIVIKTAHLKNQYIDYLGEEHVNRDFFNVSERGMIKKGDVLLSSTGKPSIGKIDFVEDDVEAIVDNHLSIIRVQNYNPLFFVYFFRSLLGYFQVERDFTGCTNQIELYADDIGEFLIPDISLSEQERIVEEIKTEIHKQDKIKKEIQQERNRIDEIIESVILSDE